MKKISLNGDWKLYYYDKLQRNVIDPDELRVGDIPSVKATVPGDVHLDLSRAGILPEDLFKGMNIRETELFETYDWWYEKEFTLSDIPAGKKITLKFEAVDCLVHLSNQHQLDIAQQNVISYSYYHFYDFLTWFLSSFQYLCKSKF